MKILLPYGKFKIDDPVIIGGIEIFTKKIYKEYEDVFAKGLKSKEALERSIDQHARIIFENTEDVFDARILARELKEEIQYRIRLYSYCIMKNTKNYKDWLEEDYMRKLRLKLSQMYANIPAQ